MNFRRIFAIEQANKKRWLNINKELNEESGIYIIHREEGGIKYAYVGQAKNILKRLAQHLSGYQHIDLSLKNHGLYNEDNQTGYKVRFINCGEEELNNKEQEFILQYANDGYQLRNKTSGSQGEGKKAIHDTVTKGYQQGLSNGYIKARKYVSKLFNKNLIFEMNGKENTHKKKAYDKFKDFIDIS